MKISVILLLELVSVLAELNFSKFQYIDHVDFENTSNFLFRSNMPQNGGRFQYDEIIRFTKIRLAEKNLTLPEPLYLVDVNLMHDFNATQHLQIQVEQDFFDANPNLGQMWLWELRGNTTNPNDLSRAERTSGLDQFTKNPD